MKTVLTLTLLALSAALLAPSAAADTFTVTATVAGQTHTHTQSAPDGCPSGLYYMTQPGSPVQSSGYGNGEDCRFYVRA